MDIGIVSFHTSFLVYVWNRGCKAPRIEKGGKPKVTWRSRWLGPLRLLVFCLPSSHRNQEKRNPRLEITLFLIETTPLMTLYNNNSNKCWLGTGRKMEAGLEAGTGSGYWKWILPNQTYFTMYVIAIFCEQKTFITRSLLSYLKVCLFSSVPN